MEEFFSIIGKPASDGFQVSVNVLFVPVDPAAPPLKSRVARIIHLPVLKVFFSQKAVGGILDQLCNVVLEEG